MSIIEFINNHEVEYTNNLVSERDIIDIEKELQITFGKELKEYCLKYGYLAYRHVELYGLNSRQMCESDMIKQTKYLHKYFSKTADYIALENTGDGNYIMVDSGDNVFEYTSEDDILREKGMKLFEYITSRFLEIDG